MMFTKSLLIGNGWKSLNINFKLVVKKGSMYYSRIILGKLQFHQPQIFHRVEPCPLEDTVDG